MLSCGARAHTGGKTKRVVVLVFLLLSLSLRAAFRIIKLM